MGKLGTVSQPGWHKVMQRSSALQGPECQCEAQIGQGGKKESEINKQKEEGRENGKEEKTVREGKREEERG